MKFSLSAAIALVGIMALSLTAQADQTFDLNWSGNSFGNSAIATGTITMDTSVLFSTGINDNSGYFGLANPFVTALSITVSGAKSGNGTFVLSDFNTLLFDQFGGNLDFTKELVGQPTSGNSWGTPNGNGGDFNLFNRTPLGTGPDGVFYFTLAADAGFEDEMVLTSFRPAGTNITPEPGTYALLCSLGLTGGAMLRRRRSR